jgi:mannosyltransferase
MIFLDGIIYKLQKFGGISTYFNELNNGLLDKKFPFKLIKYENSKNNNLDLNLITRSPRLFERYLPVSNIPNNTILHSSYYRYSLQKSVKNVITVYDFTYEKFASTSSRFFHSLQKRGAIDNADMILCISENTMNDLFYYYPKAANKISKVIHLAASNQYQNFNISLDYKFENLKVLFVGARSGYKNFIEAVKALSLRKKFYLQIIGGGKLSIEEITLLEKYMPSRYEHLINLDNVQLNVIYNNAFCLLYPSLYEGFGIPVLEAMACGCPVIASNNSSIPEIANNSSILLHKPNLENINYAIDLLLDQGLYVKYQNLGVKNSRKFSWDKTIGSTIESYNLIS